MPIQKLFHPAFTVAFMIIGAAIGLWLGWFFDLGKFITGILALAGSGAAAGLHSDFVERRSYRLALDEEEARGEEPHSRR